MINLYGMEIRKLEALMLSEGQTKYRATQLYTWIYGKKAKTFDEMTDVSLRFREVLKEKYTLTRPTIHVRQFLCFWFIKKEKRFEAGRNGRPSFSHERHFRK